LRAFGLWRSRSSAPGPPPPRRDCGFAIEESNLDIAETHVEFPSKAEPAAVNSFLDIERSGTSQVRPDMTRWGVSVVAHIPRGVGLTERPI